ncbi:glycosyltransferase family 2 protein [Burkholderia sp. WSM2230]|uniref:glycosyltransferase family 2 protein n=1 Tax=Burkholderia sp. WSM2230 TaxID=944435 RepID=UPI0004024FEE|nr:glycosyltransferase family 2 protein [Burkholderia sp. WSM2230]
MNILILGAGVAPIEAADGGYPLLLAEIDGVPLIQRVLETTRTLSNGRVIVALRKADITRFHLGNVVNILNADAKVIPVNDGVKGAACTALLAAPYLDAEEELLILNANQLLDVNLSETIESFRSRGLDAGLITFTSVHPRYSYVRVGDDGLVTEAAEKRPISQHASAGLYWFADGRQFVSAAKSMIRKDAHVEGDFYVTPVLNELVLDQRRIGVHRIDNSKYQPIKSERQLSHVEAHFDHGVHA